MAEHQSKLCEKIESPYLILGQVEGQMAAIERILNCTHRKTHARDFATTDSEKSAQPLTLREAPAWDAGFYRLDRSNRFQALSTSRKTDLLIECGMATLSEAMMIEVAGMSFMAKMALLSETLPQRELYSTFSSDEASHYRMISALVGRPERRLLEANAFLQYLDAMIQDEPKASLILLIQVVLEGWGIPYYSNLADHSQDKAVTSTLKKIVADEARHHGSGLILFDQNRIEGAKRKQLHDQLFELISMLRLGPAALVSALSRENGGLSTSEIREFIEETSALEKVASDLALIRFLLEKAGARDALQSLEDRAAFEAPRAEDCAQSLSKLLGKSA